MTEGKTVPGIQPAEVEMTAFAGLADFNHGTLQMWLMPHLPLKRQSDKVGFIQMIVPSLQQC
jgi:hypothetical protein